MPTHKSNPKMPPSYAGETIKYCNKCPISNILKILDSSSFKYFAKNKKICSYFSLT